MGARGEQAIEEALADPDLMDVTRPVAVAEAVATTAPLIPSDEMIDQLARRHVLRQVGPELLMAIRSIGDDLANPEAREALDDVIAQLLEPTEGDREAARLEAHERSMRIVATWSKRQTEAAKSVEWGRVVRELTIPILSDFMMRPNAILRRYVEPEKLEPLTDEVKRAITTTIGELSAAALPGRR